MGITCCNDAQELFIDIDECKSIEEIEYVMRSKANDIPIEIGEIAAYIRDPTQLPKVIKVENIQEEYLEKRMEYIEEIRICYVEAADLLLKKNYLNVSAVKEHMKEIIDLYTYIYDDSKKYVASMLKFKDYVANEEKLHNEKADAGKGASFKNKTADAINGTNQAKALNGEEGPMSMSKEANGTMQTNEKRTEMNENVNGVYSIEGK